MVDECSWPELEFGCLRKKPDVRMVEDLKPVLAEPEAIDENFPAYYMYRDLYESEKDREAILKSDLRYDITVIPPAKVGREYIKTFGHYHPPAEDDLSYTEIYEVIEGEAIYVLQKRGSLDNRIDDVIAVYAKKGDKVIIPPNYGHVTINPSEKTLKMANWVCRNFSSVYEPFKKLRGACYYFTESGWVKNENYECPELRKVRAVIPDWLGISRSENMYSLVNDIDRLTFLKNPSVVDYDVFEDI